MIWLFKGGAIIALVHFSYVARWLSVWLRIALTVLLALGPFLHAHYGASHLSGLHVDGMDSVHATHAHHGVSAVLIDDADDESAAVGVATSYPRQWQIQIDSPTWAAWVSVWVLFVAAPLLLSMQVRVRAWMPPAWPHLFASNSPPPSLAPPAHA